MASSQTANYQAIPANRRRIVIGLVFLLALAGTSSALWAFVLRDRFVPKRFGVVIPGEVYRSGQISRYLIQDVIERHRIGTIIDLNGIEPRIAADQQAEMSVAKAKGAQHYRFPLRGDGTGKIERFADAIEALVRSQRSGVPVLLHCAAGTQRTGACIAFYRLLVRKEPAERVYQELERYGWDPVTDRILGEYVNGHMAELAGLLVHRGVLERVPEITPVLHP